MKVKPFHGTWRAPVTSRTVAHPAVLPRRALYALLPRLLHAAALLVVFAQRGALEARDLHAAEE